MLIWSTGGTAGLTVATRLAQQGISVAVVEAGSFYEIDGGNVSQVPYYDSAGANASSLDGANPLTDWFFQTTPQTSLLGQIFHFVRGKCLGGSSARNYMVYNRGELPKPHITDVVLMYP